ncbi:MAG: HDOD domain-containing protein [Acidimicrobiales bacterium]
MPFPVRSTVDRHAAVLAAAERLVPPPGVTIELATVICDPDASVTGISSVVGRDPGLAALVLREANSALHSVIGIIDTVEAAVMRVGSGRVLALALGAAVEGDLDEPLDSYGLEAGQLRAHAVAASRAAELILRSSRLIVGREVIVGALLHDIGKLALTVELEPDTSGMLRAAGMSATAVERELIDADHAEVGALIARSWNLPDTIVELIEQHHAPVSTGARVVAVADWMANEVLGDHTATALADGEADPRAVVAALGLDAMIDDLLGQLVTLCADS